MKSMKVKTLASGIIVFTLLLSTAWSKDNPLNPAGNCFGGNWAAQYADEL